MGCTSCVDGADKGINRDDVRVVSASSSFFLLILSLRVSASRRDC